MPYPQIISRRIPYDIDGSVVGWNSNNGDTINTWLTIDQLAKINTSEGTDAVLQSGASYSTTWLFLTELCEIEAICINGTSGDGLYYFGALYGSRDTTNGQDGTWEIATFPSGEPPDRTADNFSWRQYIMPVSFSEPKKVLKIKSGAGTNYPWIERIHLYGRKASGETLDDILICDINGNELTALMDWGDRPEATEQMKVVKLKNISTTKIATGVNLQLNHGDFGLSFSVAGAWTATLDIASIPAGGLSEPIYIKNTIGNPNQILGSRAGRLIVTVGSWT